LVSKAQFSTVCCCHPLTHSKTANASEATEITPRPGKTTNGRLANTSSSHAI